MYLCYLHFRCFFCPFLTFLIVISIAINELVNNLEMGSYLYDRSNESIKEYKVHLQTIVSAVHNNQQHVDDLTLTQHNGSDRQRDTTQANMLISSVYLKNSRNLYFTMWQPMLITIIQMFDIIADVYTNV